MLVCPKCGREVPEGANFCSNCGAALKPEQLAVEAARPAPPLARAEKYEKREKREKREKAEKYEKREYGYFGPLIVGSVFIILGVLFYLTITLSLDPRMLWAYFFIIIGIIVVFVMVYAAATAARRHPPA